MVYLPGVVNPTGMDGGPGLGGTIYSVDGQLAITNCVFAHGRTDGGNGSSADYNGAGGDALGGAIYSTNCQVSLSGVMFTNNLASGGQVGAGRSASEGGGADGGAVRNDGGSVSVSRCIFVGNQVVVSTSYGEPSANGAAISHVRGSMTIQETLFQGNKATGGYGLPLAFTGRGYGGVVRAGALYNRGTVLVERSAFVQNEINGGAVDSGFSTYLVYGGLAYGGAIYDEGSLSLINCTISGNRAVGGNAGPRDDAGVGYGGGIYSTNSPSLLNVTIADNTAAAGAGPLGAQFPAGSAIALMNGQAGLTNTILACGVGQTNVSGTIHDGGHNISSDASAGFTAASSRNSTDPLLGPLSDHGGPTPTLALLPGSPALDAGDSVVAPLTDQRGVPRPQGLWFDIGAYELEALLIVSDISPSAIQLHYLSPPGWTNQFWGAADFRNWLILGTKISGANGVSQFEDADWIHWTNRFYRVQVQGSR